MRKEILLFAHYVSMLTRNNRGKARNFPEWAIQHKQKGTELRCIKNKYYLYEVYSKYNHQKRRPQKITGLLLGRITEADGFIPSKRRVLKIKIPVTTKEYGASSQILKLCDDIITALKNFFPSLWREIFILSLNRLLHKAPLKNMQFFYQESFISELYPDLNFEANTRCSRFLVVI